VDIVPTILAATGAHATTQLPGTSLLQHAAASDSYFESLSASLNRGWAPLTGIIHRDLKYIDLPIAELYDLPRDPREVKNLRDDRRRDVDEARRLLAPMIVSPSPRTVDADTVAKLRSLGYVSGNASAKKVYTAADDPKNLVALDAKMHQSIDAFERHQLDRALQLARELVDARPDMSVGRETYAFMLEANDRVPEAIHQLEIVVRSDAAGTNADDRVKLALLYSETGEPKKAIAVLQPLRNSSDPDVQNALGVALADEGDAATAEATFNRVVESDPNNAPALQNLGIVALRKDDIRGAQSYLARALELNARLPLALNTIGVVYARAGDFPHAVEYWNRAVAVDPRQYDALFNIGLVEARSGHRAEARKALRQFVTTAPQARYAADIATARKALSQLQ
ncbi:MAG TPA: tetratricopeptide repeat protein, partial [Thermoanaerobaculia bacterium]|nr:tetratricopeptide repeat protein [Thermoanaerobaculia bacterium]